MLQTGADRAGDWRGAVGVFLLALVVRGLLCAEPICLSRDGVHFVTFAKQLADDPIRWMRITTKQPGFSYLLLAAHRVLGPMSGGQTPESWQRCGELLAMIGGALVCLLIYALARRLFDRRTAIVAGLFACFWPQGGQLSADVLSDMPHLALYLLALLVAYEMLLKPGLWRPALCGLTAGGAYLIRQEALGLVVAAAIGLSWPGSRRPLRKKMTSVVILLVCFVAVVAPYSIAAGKIMPNKGPQDLFTRLSSSSIGAMASPWLLAHVVPPWLLPGQMADEWCHSGRYVFSTLFLLGLFLRRPDGEKLVPAAERSGRRLVILAVLVHLGLVVMRVGVFGEISSRYMVIPAALVIPWAAAAFVAIVGGIAARISDPTPTRRAAVWFSGYILALTPLLYYVTLPVNGGMERYRTAGLWMREHTGARGVVLAHDGLGPVMFYAGRTYPDATWLACRKSDSLADIRAIIARRKPAWFVDAKQSHQDELDEQTYFRELLGGEGGGMRQAFATGPAGRQVFVFRTPFAASRPAK